MQRDIAAAGANGRLVGWWKGHIRAARRRGSWWAGGKVQRDIAAAGANGRLVGWRTRIHSSRKTKRVLVGGWIFLGLCARVLFWLLCCVLRCECCVVLCLFLGVFVVACGVAMRAKVGRAFPYAWRLGWSGVVRMG